MKKNYIIFLLFFSSFNLSATLNEFGISNIIPSHSDDNLIFDQRINEEMTNNNLILDGRRSDNITLQNILDFIPNIKNYFEYFLNHPDNQDPNSLELIKLAIIDVEKAKKMLRPQNVTPQGEHQLRYLFNPIKVKINAYGHVTDFR